MQQHFYGTNIPVPIPARKAKLAVETSTSTSPYLLHLELDGGAHGVHLALEVVTGVHEGGELTGLGKTGAQQTRDLQGKKQASRVIAQGHCLMSFQGYIYIYMPYTTTEVSQNKSSHN